jgi:lysophospholipase L1-like esterase
MVHKTTICLLFFLITIVAFSQSTGTYEQRVLDSENNAVLNAWPPQVTPLCTQTYKIVIVGSSTAFGTGATPIDSSWARKFKMYLLEQNSSIQVINIATLGLTSWDVSPTGTVVPAPFSVDVNRNITKALSFNPNAIILNLPSNDVARGISTVNIHQNFTNIVGAATAQNVPVWVTTTQPRNGLSPAEGILQAQLRDWINLTYGNKSVDFWTDIANPDNTINTFYSAGDGVHLNNEGHHVLFTRMVEEKIWDTICRRNDIPPIARAGNDTTITTSSQPIILNGSLSTDPDGSITGYSWAKISSSPNGGTLANANNPLATAFSFSGGMYKCDECSAGTRQSG